ncbi:hypothetical protein PHYC_01660 [Phycisphaerales bacterium]|nr:hypothetical protein PHYC_01660 [Phycisphaerales bacterium]
MTKNEPRPDAPAPEPVHLDPGTLAILRCPRTLQPLHLDAQSDPPALVAQDGSIRYPIVDGIPVFVPSNPGV